MYIDINRDIEAKEFKENFFYHFDKRETFFVAVALLLGGMGYFIGLAFNLSTNQATIIMVAMAALPVVIGFYKNQGLSFTDYVRKKWLVKKYRKLKYISTEDPCIGEVLVKR